MRSTEEEFKRRILGDWEMSENKLKEGTEVISLINTRFFSKNKIYKVEDSDLDLGRIWCLDNDNFKEMLDKGQWKLLAPVEKKRDDGWGDWG